MLLPRYLHYQLQLLILLCTLRMLPSLAFAPLLRPNRHPSISCLYFSEPDNFDRGATVVNVCQRRKTTDRKNIRRKNFDDMFPRLVAFQKIHGHTQVSKEHDRDLYLWVRNLRYNYLWQVRDWPDPTGKRKRLSSDKLQRLNQINFSWETKRDWKRWPAMIDDLVKYKTQYGTTYVNPSIDRDLYEWTRNIRTNYRHQALNQTFPQTSSSRRRPRLSPRKMKALNDNGFEWEPQQRQEYLRWQDMIVCLQAFADQHGNTRVPKDYKDQTLYRWTQNLIKNYGHQLTNTTTPASLEGRRHFLSPRRLQQLEELGFEWEHRSTMWERNYQELRKYWKKNGHCHVTGLEDRKLSIFVQNQRQEYRRYVAGNATTLTTERMDALQKINFDWARSHETLWSERHQELQVYLEKTGSTNVPQDYSANYQLGQWTMNQRTKFRQRQIGQRNGMSQERIRELEKVGFEWSIPQMKWNVMFDRLRNYQEENEQVDIPTSDTMNTDLRLWLKRQRYFYKMKITSRLSDERIALMESIPGFEWRRKRTSSPSKDDWSQLFVAIREKGIAPGAKAKQHWFEGTNRWSEVKTQWTEQELVALWNEEDDEDEDEGDFFEDEESRLFLRA